MQLPSLIVPLRYSAALWAAVWVAHLAPLVALCVGRQSRLIVVPVIVLVMLSACHQLHVIWRQRHWRMLLHAAGHAQLQRSLEQAPVDIRLLVETRDLGWLIVLCWQPEEGGRKERFALCRDGMPAEMWRKLRISLRWRKLQKAL